MINCMFWWHKLMQLEYNHPEFEGKQLKYSPRVPQFNRYHNICSQILSRFIVIQFQIHASFIHVLFWKRARVPWPRDTRTSAALFLYATGRMAKTSLLR